MTEFYNNVKDRRGCDRSKIAVIRKVFNIMRSMILSDKVYRGVEKDNYDKNSKILMRY